MIPASLQGSMKRAYIQKVLLSSQTLFAYDLGKGKASSGFRILHHMKQLAYFCCQLLCWLLVVAVGQNWPVRRSHAVLPIPHQKSTISSILYLIFTER